MDIFRALFLFGWKNGNISPEEGIGLFFSVVCVAVFLGSILLGWSATTDFSVKELKIWLENNNSQLVAHKLKVLSSICDLDMKCRVFEIVATDKDGRSRKGKAMVKISKLARFSSLFEHEIKVSWER